MKKCRDCVALRATCRRCLRRLLFLTTPPRRQPQSLARSFRLKPHRVDPAIEDAR